MNQALLIGLTLLAARPASAPAAPSFRNEVVAVLSRAGCNSGSCHGAFSGQNGFRLSLFGHEPDEDFAHITREDLGRRIDQIEPLKSLLLLKAAGRVRHGGGRRLKEGSPAWQVLRRWIAAGAPADVPDLPALEKVEVAPGETTLAVGRRRPLRVTARFADGRTADVTALALYSSQDEGVAGVDADGRVTGLRPGDTFVVVSYLGQFGRTQVFVPNPGPPAGVERGWKSVNFIDEHVLAKLRKLNCRPASPCDDATFLRRVSLDLCGTLPEAGEVRAFLADRKTDKRTRKIDELLRRPEYAQWWATKLSDLTGNDNRYLGAYNWKTAHGWWSWLRVRVERNEPYDEIVRGILLATSREGRSREEYARWLEEERSRLLDRKRWDLRYHERKTLDAFWAKINNRAPEVVAQEVGHAFLGIRLDCAQCHKHPFDRWTQADFWGFAAFFPRVRLGFPRDAAVAAGAGKRPPFKEVFVANGADGWQPVRHPKSGQVLPPRLLGGAVCPDEEGKDPRLPLADWLTRTGNLQLARALVNRVWAHHLGRGLVEPTDAFSSANPPSHPELLDALARDFIRSRFDLKHLHRTILTSRTYQLDWRAGASGPAGRSAFAHYRVKRLPAEVLVDAINRVTGAPADGKDILVPPGTRAIAYPLSRPSGRVRYAFRIFGRPLRAEICDCERDNSPSLPQALYLLNDAEMLARVQAPGGRLTELLASGREDRRLVEELYLTALSRPARPGEVDTALRHLSKWRGEAKGKAARREAFEDLLWALLNLKEFVTNH